MKKTILTLLVVSMIKMLTVPTVEAAYPTDRHRNYNFWKQEVTGRSVNTVPPFILNSYKPQGIFTKTPLFLKVTN